MSQDMPPRYGREMSCRRAARLAKELREAAPQLTCEVWAIAQGLAYIRVEGPLNRGVVTLVLHSEGEVAAFCRVAGISLLSSTWASEIPIYHDAQGREHGEY